MMEQSEGKKPVNSKSALATLYVYGYGANKNPFYKQAKSLNGHSAGCSLILTGPVSCGEKLLLIDDAGQNPVVGQIVTARNLTTRMFEVEVAFDAPRPDFWQAGKQ
jgi:hypothetical protein